MTDHETEETENPGIDWLALRRPDCAAVRHWPDGSPVTATQEVAFSRMADTARRASEKLFERARLLGGTTSD